MKKSIIIFATVLFFATAATAQYKMQVKLNSGTTVNYWVSDVKDVAWSYQNPADKYVDLGLSVRWATFNVGASKPEEYGDYFAWGETESKPYYYYSKMYYKYCKEEYPGSIYYVFTKYCSDSRYGFNGFTDNKIVLDKEDDAAYVNWRGGWRMPTKEEFKELLDNCTWKWTTLNGVKGYMVVSKRPGYEDNYIFLPAAGSYYGYGKDGFGLSGYYWSSSLEDSEDMYFPFSLHFYSERYEEFYETRSNGNSVRPVYPVPASSISIDKQSVEIMQGDVARLTVTTVHENGATSNTALWSSSNTDVAIVDNLGNVKAVSVGSCIITAASGQFSVTCYVTVTPFDGSYVDLGLSVKWAVCNVGASSPEEYGDYFAWGETEPKLDYGWSSYKYCKADYDQITKYCNDSSYGYNGYTDAKTVLDPEDDVAHMKIGGPWRMPTIDEFDELCDSTNCTWTWCSMNGVYGCRIQSIRPGYEDKWIFLPATGSIDKTSKDNVGKYGYYWSSSLNDAYPHNAIHLFLCPNYISWRSGARNYGRSVRPVRK